MASLPPIDPAPVGVPKLAGSDQNGIIDGADRENAERTEPQDPGPDLADVEAMGAHPAQHSTMQSRKAVRRLCLEGLGIVVSAGEGSGLSASQPQPWQ